MSDPSIPTWPSIYAAVPGTTVTVAGRDSRVLDGGVADFACWQSDDSVAVEITHPGGVDKASVHPKALGIATEIAGERLRFTAPAGANLFVDIPGRRRLYLFTAPIDDQAPEPDDPTVHYFRAGQVHEVGVLELRSGQTLHVEAGAVVRGKIRVYGGDDITLSGAGIIDGAGFTRADPLRHLLHFDGVTGLRMRDLVLINPPTWTNVCCGCHELAIDNLHQIGAGGGNDGIDLVSVTNARVRGCFIHSGDDCIVLKAAPDGEAAGEHGVERQAAIGGPCRDILVEGCVFMNDGGGSAMEIGHELRCSEVCAITFRNCDVLGVHGFGAVFCINNMERATVHDILWEDIRVEHYYDHLVQFKIARSRYSRDNERGQIHGVTLRDITVDLTPFNLGYSHSTIGGCDAEHVIRDIRIENLRYGDSTVRSLDDFECYTKHVDGISFG